MSEIEQGAAAAAITTRAPAMPAQWRPLPPQAATTAMLGGAAIGTLLGAGPALGGGIPIAMRAFGLSGWTMLAIVGLVWIAVIGMVTWIAYRRWRATSWKLDDTGLHVRRGRMWRKEVLVPRSRVQHLDIERGPIERRYELATLIVHTAGTRQHALRLAGLPDADAVALRDALVPDPNRIDDVL